MSNASNVALRGRRIRGPSVRQGRPRALVPVLVVHEAPGRGVVGAEAVVLAVEQVHAVPLAHEAHGPVHATSQQRSSPPEQNPLAQSAPPFAGSQLWSTVASQAPAALHASCAGQFPGEPAASVVQVVPLAQDAQGPVHVTSQQRSSPPEQNPLAQSVPSFAGSQVWSFDGSQAPAALHAWPAGQNPSEPTGSWVQVVPPEQDAHGPVHAAWQQTPSPPEQKPLAHCVPPSAGSHPPPFVASQAPAALHASSGGQLPCAPAARRPHVVPFAQEAQGPAQGTLQQRSSPPEQEPLAQSEPSFTGSHACPLLASHAPAALHASWVGQAPCAPTARLVQVDGSGPDGSRVS